jgi:hypothetical protein
LIAITGCDETFKDLDVPNYNSPNQDQVYSNVKDFPSLLKGAYKSWWNHHIGPNPNFALTPAAEAMTSGYGSWGSTPYYKVPREPVPNQDGDVVLFPTCGGWFGYYQGLPAVNNILKKLELEDEKVVIGDKDYTQSTLAHAYFLQGAIYGHLALLYDKAFLLTEEDNVNKFDYEFTGYKDLMDFAIGRIDKAIQICENNEFTDPVQMMPGHTFNDQSLARFANSYAARLLAYNARTAEETQNVDWQKVLNYANKGINQDFKVQFEPGWKGLAIKRDGYSYLAITTWGWTRVHQRIIHMMAPNDENAEYPWPFGVSSMDTVKNTPDQRFEEYFQYNSGIPWISAASSKGYHILSHYTFERFDEMYDFGTGEYLFFSKAENDLLRAEAMIRSGGSESQAANLINNTRVQKGGLDPASSGDANLMRKLYYERFVETLMTYPLVPYFDRRRTTVEDMQLRPGTVRHLPVPYQELVLHDYDIYTFGGEGNEM